MPACTVNYESHNPLHPPAMKDPIVTWFQWKKCTFMIRQKKHLYVHWKQIQIQSDKWKSCFQYTLPSCRSVYSSWNVPRSVSTTVFSAFYPEFVLCYQCFSYNESSLLHSVCRKKDSFKIQPGLLDCLSTQGFTISFSFQTLIPTSNITLKWSVKPQTGVWMDLEKRELDKKLSVLQYVISLTV